MKKVYFPNLNGLRFIAALLVIVHHIEQFKSIFGLENSWHNPFVSIIGKLGVVLFFVLSGFLITYLLLVEDEQTKTISVKDFYIRRLLRIWPLYYLIAGLSFLVFPFIPFLNVGILSDAVFQNLTLKLALFIFFLPNLALIVFSPVPFASQSWSVGVEEQFYLIWPVLMKKTKKKHQLPYIVILVYFIIKISLFLLISTLGGNKYLEIILNFINGFSIDCMAIGSILAFFLFNNNSILKYLYSKTTQYITYPLLALLIGIGVKIPYINYEFYGILFGILILNLASNKNSILNLENKTLNYLGKISYGLYMYHPLAIVIALKTLIYFGIGNVFAQYSLSIGLAILIAGLSYKYFESYFIKKKLYFTKVLSGENAVEEKSAEPTVAFSK